LKALKRKALLHFNAGKVTVSFLSGKDFEKVNYTWSINVTLDFISDFSAFLLGDFVDNFGYVFSALLIMQLIFRVWHVHISANELMGKIESGIDSSATTRLYNY
jgi:hypothetical protein